MSVGGRPICRRSTAGQLGRAEHLARISPGAVFRHAGEGICLCWRRRPAGKRMQRTHKKAARN
jgi:hypothetical protein